MKRTLTAIASILAITFMAGSALAAAIPAGTTLPVRITENLSSGNAKAGQLFHGTLEAPIMANGRVLYPKGSPVVGQVVAVHPSGRLSDPGVLDLKLVSISNGHSSFSINTQLFHIKGESHAKSNAEKIGGTAAAGTVLGAIFGGGKGALIGASAGAAAGTVAAAASGKKEAKVESEAVLPFVIAAPQNTVVAQQAPAAQPAPAPQPAPVEQPAPPQPEVEAEYRQDDRLGYGRRNDDRDDDRYRREDDDQYRRDDGDRDEQRYRDENRDRYAREFSREDRRIIRSCYAENDSDLPPGLERRDDDLPPGLERHIRRDGTLPPGLQKRVRLLTRSCERRLAPVPQGWVRGVLAGRILLLDADYRIVDMFFLSEDD